MELFGRCKNASKDKFIQYGLNLLMLFIFWGGLLRKSYNYDTVYHMVVEDADVMTRIRGGRYAAALVDFLLLKLGLRTTSDISITMLFTLITLAAAMMVMQLIFERGLPENKCAKAGFFCGLNLVFLNVLFAESLMFGEYSIYYALAYLAAAAGVALYARRRYIAMFIVYVIAVTFYQNAAVFAAILTAFYIFVDEKAVLSKKAVFRELAGVTVCMSVAALDLLSIRILEKLNLIPLSAKVSGMGDMAQKLSMALGSFVYLNKNAAGIMPNLWLPLLFAALIWITLAYSRIKEHKPAQLLFLFLVCMGSYMLLYVIPLASEEFYFPPRLSFCFFMVQGLLLAAAYSITGKTLHKLLGIIGISYMLLHLFFSGFIIADHFVSNALDEAYIRMLYGEIVKYEKETGIEVTKIAVMKDADSPSSYREVTYVSGQINERTIDAVPVSIIQVVTGRDLEKIDMPDAIEEKYFKDKDWEHFDLDEQLIIEGDTAYWCVF